MTSLLERMDAFRMTASWAVWPPSAHYDKSSDISFPVGDLEGILHARSIILGLNPGESDIERKPWHNFHMPGRHNDHFLAEGFQGTSHWGAYMTDLLTEVNSKSNRLDLSQEVVVRDVEVLMEQLRLLNATDPLFIVIGRRAAEAFLSHEAALASACGCARVRWAEIPHYSAANGRVHGNNPRRYRELVLSAISAAPSRRTS